MSMVVQSQLFVGTISDPWTMDYENVKDTTANQRKINIVNIIQMSINERALLNLDNNKMQNCNRQETLAHSKDGSRSRIRRGGGSRKGIFVILYYYEKANANPDDGLWGVLEAKGHTW